MTHPKDIHNILVVNKDGLSHVRRVIEKAIYERLAELGYIERPDDQADFKLAGHCASTAVRVVRHMADNGLLDVEDDSQ